MSPPIVFDSDHESVRINGATVTSGSSSSSSAMNTNNWPLFASLSSGLMLLMASGTEIGSTLFGGKLRTQSWQDDADTIQFILVHCMFFVGSIVGGFNAGYFIDNIGRKHTMKIAFGSLTINTVLLILASNKIVALIIARLCSGYTFGLLYVTLIAMTGEIAPRQSRGFFTSLVYFFTFLGAFLFALVNMFHKFQNVNQIVGWITLALLILAIPAYYFFALETPHYHCMKNNHSEGLQTLLYLRNERVISNSRKQEFVEIQQSVSRDTQSLEMPVLKNRIFYILAILRVPVLLSFNSLLNHSQMNIIIKGLAPDSDYLFQPLMLAGIHIMIGLIAMFAIDKFKRIYFFTIPLLVASVFLLVTGSALSIKEFNPFVFIIMYEIFHGLGIGMTVDVVSGEGFAIQKKGIALSLLNAVYMLGHIVLIIITMSITIDEQTNQIILCVHGAALVICGLIRVVDTKQKTLNEARDLLSINFLAWKF